MYYHKSGRRYMHQHGYRTLSSYQNKLKCILFYYETSSTLDTSTYLTLYTGLIDSLIHFWQIQWDELEHLFQSAATAFSQHSGTNGLLEFKYWLVCLLSSLRKVTTKWHSIWQLLPLSLHYRHITIVLLCITMNYHCITIVLLLHYHCITTTLILHYNNITIAWQLHYHCITTAYLLHSHHATTTLLLHYPTHALSLYHHSLPTSPLTSKRTSLIAILPPRGSSKW